MNAIFAGGGTGGHLFPGLALAEELRRRRPDGRRLFLCTERDAAYPALASSGFEATVLPSRNRGPLPLRLLAMLPACRRAFGLLRQVRPDIVIGLGGYASVAPVLCARLLRVPSMLLEQNVIPGRSNRFLSHVVGEVASQWKEARRYFPRRGKVRHTGNPIRSCIRRRDRAEAAGELGLDPGVPTLLVMGGSQGATPLNNLVLEALPRLEDPQRPLQVVHLAGRNDAERARQAYRRTSLRHAVFDFLEDMALAYSAADLAFCRAGGTSIAELTALGVPSLLVPLPHATDNHQHFNASVLECHGAAILLEQRTLTAQRLADCVTRVIHNPDRLAELAGYSRDMGVPDAAAAVADRAAALARPRPRPAVPAPARAGQPQ